MHELDAVSALHNAAIVTLKLCAPLLLAPLVTGVAVALFQAVTQISDSTLSFLPKLVATVAAAWYTGPFLARTIADFVRITFDRMILAGGQ